MPEMETPPESVEGAEDTEDVCTDALTDAPSPNAARNAAPTAASPVAAPGTSPVASPGGANGPPRPKSIFTSKAKPTAVFDEKLLDDLERKLYLCEVAKPKNLAIRLKSVCR